ncbi:MAG: glycosyltransferase [Gammaproteobacteria bacterium]|nr:glycosyltransferase [Gammaproteobacteria bacterium]
MNMPRFNLSYLLTLPSKVIGKMRKYGISYVLHRIKEQYFSSSRYAMNPANHRQYQRWLQLYDNANDARTNKLHATQEQFYYRPLISILVPVYNPEVIWLDKAIKSVLNQIYDHWQLCLADDCSSDPDVINLLKKYEHLDARIKVVYRKENGHISAATNSSLEIAEGEYIGLLDNDDELHQEALFWVVNEINNNPDAQLIFSDEDKLLTDGTRIAPYFKPDFNYDLFLSQNMITHFGVYKTDVARRVGGFRLGYEGSQDWDFALRFLDDTGYAGIYHIPRVLYHWRMIPTSTASNISAKNYALEAGIRTINDHLKRRQIKAHAVKHPELDNVRVIYDLPDSILKVSIIIPTRNRVDLLKTCIGSILQLTGYKNYEIIIVDNDSDCKSTIDYISSLCDEYKNIRSIRHKGEFNYSQLNNIAVQQAMGEYICLMNNDIEVISRDWLREMLSHAARKKVACVGAKLYYPNNRIQHAGVILGMGGVAEHFHKLETREANGYFSRAKLIQNFSAVTAACMMVRKSIYLELGGLDEINLKVAFNDIDFCLRALKSGYINVWTPFAELYHHESCSRGADDTLEKKIRFKKEIEYMSERWGDMLMHDPAYNPNLSLNVDRQLFAFPPRLDQV